VGCGFARYKKLPKNAASATQGARRERKNINPKQLSRPQQRKQAVEGDKINRVCGLLGIF